MPEKNPAAKPTGSPSAPRGPSHEGDDRDDMLDQVLELAEVFATPEKRAAYLREVEEKEAREFRKQKAKERKERGGDHNPLAGIFSELLGGVIASASWLIAGCVLIAVLGGGVWFVAARHSSANAAAPQPQILAQAVPADAPTILPTTINPSAIATAVSPAAVATAIGQMAVNTKTGAAAGAGAGNGAQAKAVAKTGAKMLASSQAPGKGGAGSGSAAAHPASGTQGAGKNGTPGGPSGSAPPPGTANQPGTNAAVNSAPGPNQQAAPVSPAAATMDAKNSESMANLPPDLKKLWIQGANAKHRGDYAGARRAWQAALKIDPSHYGFQESIDKLPKA